MWELQFIDWVTGQELGPVFGLDGVPGPYKKYRFPIDSPANQGAFGVQSGDELSWKSWLRLVIDDGSELSWCPHRNGPDEDLWVRALTTVRASIPRRSCFPSPRPNESAMLNNAIVLV